MITCEQIRAALAALRWSRRMLSEKTGLSEKTIQRIVEGTGVPNSQARVVANVVDVLKKGDEERGVEFIFHEEVPGVLIYDQTQPVDKAVARPKTRLRKATKMAVPRKKT